MSHDPVLKMARQPGSAEKDISVKCPAEVDPPPIGNMTQVLLDATQGMALLVDLNGRLLALNRATAEQAGKTVSELVGENVHSLFPHVKLHNDRIDEVIRTGCSVRFEDRQNGRILDHSIWPVLDNEGRIFSLAIIVRDQTDELEMTLEIKAANEMLHAIAYTDDLTGLPNRRHFLEVLHKEFHRIRRYGGTSVVALLDVDHFKSHNDRYGHVFGDQVLVEVASILRGEMRQTDAIARYGGDEFVILMTQTPVETAVNVIDRIRARAQCGTLGEQGQQIPIQFSAGLAHLATPDQKNTHDALQTVDAALYKAKADGRNCTRIG